MTARRKTTNNTKPSAPGFYDNEEELRAKNIKPQFDDLTVKIDKRIMQSLQIRQKQMSEICGQELDMSATLQDVVEMGLRHNMSFQNYLSRQQEDKKTNGASKNGEQKNKRDYTTVAGTNGTNTAKNNNALDDDDIEKTVEQLGSNVGAGNAAGQGQK